MLEKVLRTYNEPMLNLHFMGPYLKSNLSSINMYDIIFKLISIIPEKFRRNLMQMLRDEIRDKKDALLQG